MRFQRYYKGQFQDTARKRALYSAKLSAERERYPLFPDVIAAEQVDVETTMARRAARFSSALASDRARQAALWIEARQTLASFPRDERVRILAFWNRAPYPGTPVYLMGLLHRYRLGRIELDPPPAPAITQAQREAVDQVIARIQARQEGLARAAR